MCEVEDLLYVTKETVDATEVLTTTRTNNLLNPKYILENTALDNKGTTTSSTETWYLNNEFVEVEANMDYCFYAEGFTGDYTNTGYRVILYCYDAEQNFMESVTSYATTFTLYLNVRKQKICRFKMLSIPDGCQYVKVQYFATLKDCALTLQKYETFDGTYEPYLKAKHGEDFVLATMKEEADTDFRGNLKQYAMNFFANEKTISGYSYKDGTGVRSSTSESMLLGDNPIVPTKDYVFYSLDFADYTTGYNVTMICMDENGAIIKLLASQGNAKFATYNGVKCKVFAKYTEDTDECMPAETRYCALIYSVALDNCSQNVFCSSEYASLEYKTIHDVPFGSNMDMEQMKESLNVLETKLDETAVSGDETETELINMRDGVDGKLYDSAGNAIRNTLGQIYNPQNKGNWLYSNSFTDVHDLLTSYANSLYYDTEAFKYRVKLGYSEDTLSHDANLQIKNGIAYVTCIVNQIGSFVDDPTAGHTLSRLCVFDCSLLGTNLPEITSYVIAEYGSSLPDGTLLDEGTGVTNCNFIDDTTLRCTFMAHPTGGDWGEYYRDFDITTNTFGDITVCQLTKDGVTLDFTVPNVYQLFGITSNDTMKSIFTNAQTAYEEASGYFYRAMWIRDLFDNGVILRSTDLASYEFFMIPEFSRKTHMNYECSMICDQKGKLYLAMRQAKLSTSNGNTEMLVAKVSIADKKVLQEITIADCSMKACFFTDGSNIYLFHGTNQRKRFEMIEINQTYLIDSKIIMQSSLGCVYPSIQKYGDSYYIASTGNSSTGIYLRKFSLAPFTVDDINNKFISLLGIDQMEI